MASSSQSKPVDKYSLLCNAIRRKDNHAARRLILNNAPVNPPTKSLFDTPLHLAILSSDNVEIVNMLIERGADLSCKNKYERTPLIVAIQFHKQKVIELLLGKGAHVFEDLEELFNDMMRYGNPQIVETIVKRIIQIDKSIDFRIAVNLAAASGRVSILQFLLTQNVNDTEKELPREVIIKNGPKYKQCLKLLLRHGYRINASEKKDFEAVYAAVEKGYITIVDELLKTGVNVNTVNNKTGLSLLHLACSNGNTNMVKLLIEHKANINMRIHYPSFEQNEWQPDEKMNIIVRRTALFITVSNADIGMTKLLLTNGANIKDEPDILKVAIKTKCIRMIERLLELGADINVVDHKGMTPLHFYIMENVDDEYIKYPMVEFLLSQGANTNLQTYNNKITPFHAAIERGYTSIVKLLLKYHADLTLATANGHVPLYVAVINDRIDIVDILSKSGADVNIKDGRGYTSLHHACLTNNEMMIDQLLANNADINCVDSSGKTPLHLMCTFKCNMKIILKLLSHHADVNIKDQHNETPLHSLTQTHSVIHCCPSINSTEFKKVYRIFLESIADNAVNSQGRTPLFLACLNEDLPIVRLLLENGADVNIPDVSGKTSLHAAAKCTRIEMIKMLLENNAKSDSVDKYGNTILHIAAHFNNLEILKIIDKLSIDINAKNNDGNTALHIATRRHWYGIAEKLLEEGADINAVNSVNRTVFDIAIDHIIRKHADIAKCGRNNYTGKVKGQKHIKMLKFMIEIFHRHVTKLKFAGLYVSNRILDTIDNNVRSDAYDFCDSGQHMLGYESRCENEIQRLKQENVGSTTLYKLLSNDIHYIAKYYKNQEITEVLQFNYYNYQFPLYINTIRRRFREGIARSELLELIHVCDLSDIFHGLRYILVDEILRYLDFQDLKTIINVIKPKK